MATIIGRNTKVAISAAGATYTEIGKITSASLSYSDDIADETNNDSGGFKEGKYADSQATLDIQCKFDSSDAGQVLLLAAKTSKTGYYFRFRPAAATGERQIIFVGLVESYDVDTSTGEVSDLAASISSTGAIATSIQT
jgi:hypothetical protein